MPTPTIAQFEAADGQFDVPIWAGPPGVLVSDTAAAFAAGGALNPLDRLVEAEPPWAGAWRYRLAHIAAEAALQLIGRTDEIERMRDDWHLRDAGDPGPAGNMLLAWRRLVERSRPPDDQGLRNLVRMMGLKWTDGMDGLADELTERMSSIQPVPEAVLTTMRMVHERAPGAGPLMWWVADMQLARRMRWPLALPVLSVRMMSVEAKYPTFVPVAEDAMVRLLIALGNGAVNACRQGSAIQARARTLVETLPKIKTKGADTLAKALFEQEAVQGFNSIGHISRWSVRRFMGRMEAAGAAVELTGRDTFRLYGL